MSAIGPDDAGRFGDFGGRFMPEALMAALDELTAAWQEAMADEAFTGEFHRMLHEYAGVPSLLYDATKLSELAGARILLKREDLNHTGAHKIRNVLGQALLTKRMGKTRVIAETGAGQHGVATATAAAYLGLECTVYMGEVDTERQALNVARMQLLGAEVIPVSSGSRTLKDAINEAIRDWVASVDHTAYCFGTAAGPHPFPAMVRDFCRGIGDEAREQCLDLTGALPDAIAACVGGGSNAIGLFTAFLDDPEVAIYGFEAAGDGVDTERHAATIWAGEVGVLHGARTYVLQDEDGQTVESHSISAGLDYRVGPQHAYLAKTGRATYLPVTDAAAMDALALLAKTEGIIPAIESAHAVAGALDLAKERPGQTILVNLSGRGDKDMGTAIDWFGLGQADADGTPEPATDEQIAEGARVTTSTAFDKARAEGRGALVGYLPAGFPDVAGGIEALEVMVDSGCDVIEVGLPYSDPVMDGPTIQAAAQRALEGGTRTSDVLRTVEAVAATGTPTVVMTYWNPVERYGVQRFAADLASAGGAGLITPDLTPDSAEEWIAAADERDLDKVFLVAPSSTDQRLRYTVEACRGFVYATAVMGVTGARASTSELAGPLVARTRAVTDLPIGVGLGVSNGDQAAEVASYADAVIVGSAFVRALLDADDKAGGLKALASLTEDLAAGVRRG